MTEATALHALSLAEAAALIRRRQLSPRELVEALLSRIAAVDGVLHSYITVAAETARKAAATAEAEIMGAGPKSPLHGIPYGLKDNFFTRGVRSTAASRLLHDHVPDTDATAHARLQQAGAILLGKLATFEYGTGTGADLFALPFPPARNPWDPRRFTGGSSTGAGAAVAGGTATFALGSDTTGSVRLPASGCGLVGLKPTYGRVSRAGVLPNCWTLDAVGPLTWSVADAALVLQAIAGHDPRDPASAATPVPDYAAALGQGVRGLRVGVLRRFHEQDLACEAEVSASFDAAVQTFAALGAQIVDLDFPIHTQDFRNCSRLINAGECYAIHERDFVERRALMGPALRDKLTAGLALRATDYLRAQRARRALAVAVAAAFARCDVVLCVTTMRRAPMFDDTPGVIAFTFESATAPFSISGHPALSMCSGFSSDGLPLAIQIAGRPFDEATLLRAAAAFEQATDTRARRPDPLRLGTNFAVPATTPAPPGAPASPAVRDLAARAGIVIADDAEAARIESQAASLQATAAKLPAAFAKDVEPMTGFHTLDAP